MTPWLNDPIRSPGVLSLGDPTSAPSPSVQTGAGGTRDAESSGRLVVAAPIVREEAAMMGAWASGALTDEEYLVWLVAHWRL